MEDKEGINFQVFFRCAAIFGIVRGGETCRSPFANSGGTVFFLFSFFQETTVPTEYRCVPFPP